MSRALITESYLTDIADAIRAKNGSSDTYTPPQMAAAIQAIPTGGGAFGSSGLFGLYTFAKAGGDNPYITTRNGLPCLARTGNYNWHMCFMLKVPTVANNVHITVESQRGGTSYTRFVEIGSYASSDASGTFTKLVTLVDSQMTIEQIMAQSRIVALNLSANDQIDKQTVVVDVSDISNDFYLGLFVDYQSFYLYDIYCT